MTIIDFKYFFGWTGRYAKIGLSCLHSRFIAKTPFIFSHSLTHACNSRCKTCGRWKFSNLAKNDLTTEQVFKLLKEAVDFGMRGYYAFGGEPMLRKDIVEILKYAHDLGMITVLNTNGFSVAQRAKEISQHTDFCYISIDAPDEQHDFIRGRKGSFKEAVEAVKKMSEAGGTRTTIVSVASKLNIDRMEEMANFATKLGVGIEFNAVDPSPTDPHNVTRLTEEESYALTPDQLHQFYVTCLELKRKGYPVMDSEKVLEEYINKKPWKCHFPKIFCYISPDGYFVPCTYNANIKKPVNILETSLKDFFNSEEYHTFVKSAENCNDCLRPCIRMYSYAFDFFNPFKLKALASTIKTFKSSNREGLWECALKPSGKV